ncbi:branched-chain amino acid ABC transporter permease [Bradyrhizobium sp. LB11.1]|uniref:branched-chain amino acid ABC transporter permease n=1 Tax=Bradyrhizobium sp. LB11.1 TaxID=3156326 RepID=UPI0033977BE8
MQEAVLLRTAKESLSQQNDFASATSQNRNDWIVFAVIVSILWSVPLSLGGFYLYLGLAVAIYAISALGLQTMVGLAGQLSLGHAAFMGIGAYTSVLLQKTLGLPFLVTLAAAGLTAAAAGLLMAQLIRLSGVYFKIATFGFGIVVHQILSNWTALTGGTAGVRGIPVISMIGFQVETRTGLFVCEALTLTLIYGLLVRLSHGKIGRAFRAIGQNEAAARSVGIPVARYRMIVITLGCAIAGIAGAYLPHLMRFLSPESFTWYESLTCLIMITVGGLGSLPGAIIGAAVLIVAPEYLRDFAQYKMLAFGVLLVASMILLPKGIAGAGAALSRSKRNHAR